MSLALNIFNHPFALIFLLIFETFLICIFIGVSLQTFWFSYILFLVFIGGTLILFSYVISLIKSSKIYIKKNVNLLIGLTGRIFFIIKFKNLDLNIRDRLENYNVLNWFKLFNFPLNIINLFLINFLFFILIITVKFTKNFFGPLRSKYR